MLTMQSLPEPRMVLAKAVLRAAERLDIPQAELSLIIGRDRSSVSRNGIDPGSKSGELSKLFIRCYRSLAVLVNDNSEQMRHWLYTPNAHTGGIPARQLKTVAGLAAVTEYLDAIRAKV